jgi:hypothetical protein
MLPRRQTRQSRIHHADALRAGAVGVGQVGDGELARFGETGVAVSGQLLLPVPDVVAHSGLDPELVVQADFHNAVDVAQAFGQLKVGWLCRRRSQRCR